jgi:hydrogenase nickel incorporation protein HypA/HybF
MHELPVTESILEIVLRHAQTAQARRVTALHIVMGELSTLVDDSVQFYWDLIAQGTPAEGARLHFKRIAAELLCQACQHRYGLTGDSLACPLCGSTNVQVVAGDEAYLESIEIEN